MQKHQKRICIFNLLKCNSAVQRWKLIIPASLQRSAISWYHCYLQHPSHSSLKETLKSMMYWKGMHMQSSNVKSCRSCQKQETQPKVWSCTIKAGHNDSLKSIMCTPHEVINTLLKAKTKQVLISCASSWLIQQQVDVSRLERYCTNVLLARLTKVRC